MKPEENYIAINKDNWNQRIAAHLTSDFYDHESFKAGNSSLNEIELDLFEDLKGKRVLHLQCHFGQDTISLARMGASTVGVDLSDEAIKVAKACAQELNADASFICCDVYDLHHHLDEKFDVVFTSYGTIGWLPDMEKWAKVISHFLKPNGRLYFVEFHPVVWMFDYDFKEVAYNYFNTEAIVEEQEATYADSTVEINAKAVSWNHPISEVVNNLIQAGMEIEVLNEYDYSPYNCFKHTQKVADRKYRIVHMGNKLPMVYAIKAVRK
ncbi:Methyltransferase domain-containing protein [Lishizhenia tianjinensis]|uniref:Methyltransferase domain-containing protein n=1 Tax=Lishizhenia tianjinensis TaxID=477690 RepID=A0A1I7BUB6_9FLAO|nr:class I SAM-dependent methyltransferase [Lishizhenia tianjinensis]SFT90711.1 Methyltransferase domain-containing protein [Lishizhenia tianjinensis]